MILDGADDGRTWQEWLDSHVNLERGDPARNVEPSVRVPTLDRIRQLTRLLGDPQSAYPIVHVTGTNGKTSTARMTAALLAARGLSVGLYTSPHLVAVNERINWNGEPISDDDLDAVLGTIRTAEVQMDDEPTYFEIMTAAAFAWFADIAVDAAVIEVGLGGMWDATNVGDGTVAAVTNVGIDHVEYLGPTRASIAKEKAGIVKEGAALVLGETDPELEPLFLAAGPEVVYRRHEHFDVEDARLAHEGWLLDLLAPSGRYDGVFLPVHGRYQAGNAACALAAAEAFFGGERFADEVVEGAFASLRLPGRVEVAGRHPLVVLDGAHNPEGAQALRATLDEEFPADGRTLVVGLLREKDPHEMLQALGVGAADRLVACRPPSPRAMAPQAVADAAVDLGVDPGAVEVTDAVAEALARALALTPPEAQVVVTGSLYTVGAARSALSPE